MQTRSRGPGRGPGAAAAQHQLDKTSARTRRELRFLLSAAAPAIRRGVNAVKSSSRAGDMLQKSAGGQTLGVPNVTGSAKKVANSSKGEAGPSDPRSEGPNLPCVLDDWPTVKPNVPAPKVGYEVVLQKQLPKQLPADASHGESNQKQEELGENADSLSSGDGIPLRAGDFPGKRLLKGLSHNAKVAQKVEAAAAQRTESTAPSNPYVFDPSPDPPSPEPTFDLSKLTRDSYLKDEVNRRNFESRANEAAAKKTRAARQSQEHKKRQDAANQRAEARMQTDKAKKERLLEQMRAQREKKDEEEEGERLFRESLNFNSDSRKREAKRKRDEEEDARLRARSEYLEEQAKRRKRYEEEDARLRARSEYLEEQAKRKADQETTDKEARDRRSMPTPDKVYDFEFRPGHGIDRLFFFSKQQ